MRIMPIVIDTASNYRNGRGEQDVLDLIQHAHAGGRVKDINAWFIITKIGYMEHRSDLHLLEDRDIITLEDMRKQHSLSPQYIDTVLESLNDAKLSSQINCVLLHNPERSLRHLLPADRERRLLKAFELLEEWCGSCPTRYYGVASWDGFGTPRSSPVFTVHELALIARRIAGASHRMRFIELPVSFVNIWAVHDLLHYQTGPIAEAIQENIAIVASSPLHGGMLPRAIDSDFAEYVRPGATSGQACLLFSMSVPGISVTVTSPSDPKQAAAAVEVAGWSLLDIRAITHLVDLIVYG